MRRVLSLGLILALTAACAPDQRRTAAVSTLTGLGAGAECAAPIAASYDPEHPEAAGIAALGCLFVSAAAAVPPAPTAARGSQASPADSLTAAEVAFLRGLIEILATQIAPVDPGVTDAIERARELIESP